MALVFFWILPDKGLSLNKNDFFSFFKILSDLELFIQTLETIFLKLLYRFCFALAFVTHIYLSFFLMQSPEGHCMCKIHTVCIAQV